MYFGLANAFSLGVEMHFGLVNAFSLGAEMQFGAGVHFRPHPNFAIFYRATGCVGVSGCVGGGPWGFVSLQTPYVTRYAFRALDLAASVVSFFGWGPSSLGSEWKSLPRPRIRYYGVCRFAFNFGRYSLGH